MQKKICVLGAFSVGKTSLIKQFVSSIFDERYLTTIGVKIDKKQVKAKNTTVSLMIWDLAGEDAFNSLQPSYLRGSAGYILVVDGTRPGTVEAALKIDDVVTATIGKTPCMLALNKSDLTSDWLLAEQQQRELMTRFDTLRTSARTGANVEQLFIELAGKLV